MPYNKVQSIVGVIPAAGRATRLAPLPCSKELLPVGVQQEPPSMRGHPKVVSEYLLEKMRLAGAQRVYFVVRRGKFDIAEYYGDGARLGLSLAYLMMADPYGPPFSVAQATPFIGDSLVLLGFPDILVEPADALKQLVDRISETGADLVLGLFRAKPDEPIDIVTRTSEGRVVTLVTKEEQPTRDPTDIGYLLAAWRPTFTAFLTQQVAATRVEARESKRDWPMGAVIAAAIRDGLNVDSVLFDRARFLDIGTPAGLAAAGSFPGIWSG